MNFYARIHLNGKQFFSKETFQRGNYSASCAGYNLLQMAFAMIVLGLLSVSFIQIYSIYKMQQDYIRTQELVENAVQKLQIYKQSRGFYPCPAPNVARGAPGYGSVSACDGSIAAGTCAGGICVQSSNRGGTIGTINVRIGTIPFRELQMDEKAQK